MQQQIRYKSDNLDYLQRTFSLWTYHYEVWDYIILYQSFYRNNIPEIKQENKIKLVYKLKKLILKNI